MSKLVIIGDSAFAEIAYEYFTHDSDYQVVGFAVEKAFRKQSELFGLPVIDFEDMPGQFDPREHHVFAALVYTQMNRARTRLALESKNKGYKLASYVSSRAFLWSNVEIGEHCFIFEDNTVQPFVEVGNNVVMWSGNHIGHHSVIRDNVFFSSHVVLSGYCDVGRNSFMGVNSTVSNNVTIAEDTWLGPGVVILADTEAGQFYKPAAPKLSSASAYQRFKIEDPGTL
jgi:sugar O-acyltransferase (sialic acid O-acetyltransferase NeuD family)